MIRYRAERTSTNAMVAIAHCVAHLHIKTQERAKFGRKGGTQRKSHRQKVEFIFYLSTRQPLIRNLVEGHVCYIALCLRRLLALYNLLKGFRWLACSLICHHSHHRFQRCRMQLSRWYQYQNQYVKLVENCEVIFFGTYMLSKNSHMHWRHPMIMKSSFSR